MAVPHKLRGGPDLSTSTTEQHYTGIYTLLKPINHLPGMLDCMGSPIIYQLTCNRSGTMAVSLTGTASLTLPTKSQLSARNNTSDETFITQLSQGEGTLRQFFES